MSSLFSRTVPNSLCSRPLITSHSSRLVMGQAAAKSNIVASSRAAVMDRPALGEQLIVQPEQQPEYLSLSQESEMQYQFQEYQNATAQLNELEALSNALLSNLQELNEMEPLVEQRLAVPSLEQTEERRLKRAASRAARKALLSTQPASSSSSSTAPLASSSSISKSAIDAQLAALVDTKQRLQHLIQQAPSISPSSQEVSASVSTSSASTSTSLMISPSLQRHPSQTSLAIAGPSLLPVSARQSFADEPSAWAREKHQKRTRTNSRRATGLAEASGQSASGKSANSNDSTTQFMKRASTSDLLTGDSEKGLTTIVKDLLKLESVKVEIRSILKREPTILEWAKAMSMEPDILAARVSAGQQAKTMMMQSNYRLVMSICKKYQNRGLGMQDLITAGMQGLLRGVEKFDQTKGFRFSTYAHWWIRQSLARSLSDQTRTVRLPAHVYEQLIKIQQMKAQLVKLHGKDPTTAQIAEGVGLTRERVEEIISMSHQTASLDQPMAADGDGTSTLLDLLEDDREQPDDGMDSEMLSSDLERIFAELTDREAGVIKMRFGLGGSPELSLEIIGARFNITRERVRQIEAKAVRKLKGKHSELLKIMQEYSDDSLGSMELASRASKGTKKT